MLSVGAVLLLLLALIAVDDRVRGYVTNRLLPRPATEVSTAVGLVRSEANTIAMIAREESRGHATLIYFGLAAAILVVFMLRT
jgi:hypothetical protein